MCVRFGGLLRSRSRQKQCNCTMPTTDGVQQLLASCAVATRGPQILNSSIEKWRKINNLPEGLHAKVTKNSHFFT